MLRWVLKMFDSIVNTLLGQSKIRQASGEDIVGPRQSRESAFLPDDVPSDVSTNMDAPVDVSIPERATDDMPPIDMAPMEDSGPIAPSSNADVVSAIKAAAEKNGVDPVRLLALAMHETGGKLNADAVNSASGAKGLFQALPAWAEQYGIKGKEFDVAAASDAAARSLKGSMSSQNPYISYLIHNQGRKGAEVILRAAAGEGSLPDRIKRNIVAQPGFRGGDIKSDKYMALAFIKKQRSDFMKHYNRAQNMLGGQEATASRGGPSSSIKWDELMARAGGSIEDSVAGQLASAMPSETRMPTPYGSKR